MEKRKPIPDAKKKLTPTPLPVDYVKMLREVLENNFSKALKALQEKGFKGTFHPSGAIFFDEILLTVSLVPDGKLSSITVHSSVDFDPQASAPKAEELLAACVDAVGSVFGEIMSENDEERLEHLAHRPVTSLDEIPLSWTSFEVNKRTVHVKVDSSNPVMEQMADDWLAKNDPDHGQLEEKSAKEAEELLNERIENRKKFH